MKIQSKDPKLTQLFLQRVLVPFDVIKYPVRDLLKDWTIIIGENPIQDEFPYPHVNPLQKLMVLPFYNTKLLGFEEQFINIDCQLGLHEIGHVWHFETMPNASLSDPKWLNWSKLTGNKLDFIYTPRTQVPSFERVAYDFERLNTYQLDEVYFELLDAKMTTDFIVLRACEVAKGYVPAGLLTSIKERTLNKYK